MVNNITSLSKIDVEKKWKRELKHFLSGKSVISFSSNQAQPFISIILVLYNRAEFTLACLLSLQENLTVPFEIIVIDNHSSDFTSNLLNQVHNITVVKNQNNVGFVKACNQGAKVASGTYLLFLNNDTQIEKASIETALKVLNSSPNIGAVGAKLILPDGTLQEAGSIIWSDGSCLGYGRGKDPFAYEFMFSREVDFCSAAFLMTPSKLFKELGGFDEIYTPAYYEETDYCVKLHLNNYKVIYHPEIIIYHYEFASSASRENAIQLQNQNRQKFMVNNLDFLQSQLLPNKENILRARYSDKNIETILYIDDRVPHINLGSGFPRSNQIINTLCEFGYHVTIYPLNFPDEGSWTEIYTDIPIGVEVAKGLGRKNFLEFMLGRKNVYDVLWISRPHNMQFIKDYLFHIPETCKIIYDAEAIFANRDIAYSRNIKEGDDNALTKYKLQEELKLASFADCTVSVNESETKTFEEFGVKNVIQLDAQFDFEDTNTSFGNRQGLLFVGNMDYDESPNVDSLIWFYNEVYPIIQERIGEIEIHLVGSNKNSRLNKIVKKSKNFIFHGKVMDLKPYFEKCKIFIAPTRYAAGSPAKILQAACYGIPIVATDLLIDQLDWDEVILSAPVNNAQLFAEKIFSLYENEKVWLDNKFKILKQIQTVNEINDLHGKLKRIIEIRKITQPSDALKRITHSSDWLETDNDELFDSIILKIKELQNTVAHLQKENHAAKLYVNNLLTQIQNKNEEIEKRGQIIENLKSNYLYNLGHNLIKPLNWVSKTYHKLKESFLILTLLLKMLLYSLKYPGKVISQINLENINILKSAIKNENPSEIFSNFKRLIKDSS